MKSPRAKSSPSSVISASSADDDASQNSETRDRATMNESSSSNANSVPTRKRASPRRVSDASRSKPTPARAFVEHHYHDHARDPLAKSTDLVGPRPDSVMSRSFPEKLHALLEAMDEEGLEHVASWQPHGRCFVIRDKTEFVTNIMPRFFMQTKLTSFQRQLNLYGFIRLTAGKDRGGYYHEYFLRGRPDLCRFMVRTRVKGIGMKAASSPATEPDFYSYEPCPYKGPLNAESDGDGESVSSHHHQKKTTGDNTKMGLVDDESRIPNIVSPPVSPVISSSVAQICPDLLPSSFLDMSNEIESSMPHTGDEVFFEGLKFRYLDHLDLDDVQDINVTNVEYL